MTTLTILVCLQLAVVCQLAAGEWIRHASPNCRRPPVHFPASFSSLSFSLTTLHCSSAVYTAVPLCAWHCAESCAHNVIANKGRHAVTPRVAGPRFSSTLVILRLFVVLSYLRRRRWCFHFCLLVCLSVCKRDQSKSCGPILTELNG